MSDEQGREPPPPTTRSGLVVPTGQGDFKEQPQTPSCPVCHRNFVLGDTVVTGVTDVSPGNMTVAHIHLSCALAIAQARVNAMKQAEAGASVMRAPSLVNGACEDHPDGCPQGAHPRELALIEKEGVPPGYFLEHIEFNMDEVTLRRWREWYRGQTGAIVGGNMLVYKHDYDRFVRNEGRPDTAEEWD